MLIGQEIKDTQVKSLIREITVNTRNQPAANKSQWFLALNSETTQQTRTTQDNKRWDKETYC